MGRKLFGVFLIILAVLFSLLTLSYISNLINSVLAAFLTAPDTLTAGEIGYVLGYTSFWLVLLGITILLWRFGLKAVKTVKI